MKQGERGFPALKTETAFPAAGASTQSAGLEVHGGSVGGQDMARIEGGELYLKIPENTILVATKTLTLKVQHSLDDGGSDAYSDVGEIASIAVVGKTGNGLPDADAAGFTVDNAGNVLIHWPIPRSLKGFVRVHVAVEAAGGNLTGLSPEFGLLV